MSKLDFWQKCKPDIEKYCVDHNLSVAKFRDAFKSMGPDDYVVHAEAPDVPDRIRSGILRPAF